MRFGASWKEAVKLKDNRRLVTSPGMGAHTARGALRALGFFLFLLLIYAGLVLHTDVVDTFHARMRKVASVGYQLRQQRLDENLGTASGLQPTGKHWKEKGKTVAHNISLDAVTVTEASTGKLAGNPVPTMLLNKADKNNSTKCDWGPKSTSSCTRLLRARLGIKPGTSDAPSKPRWLFFGDSTMFRLFRGTMDLWLKPVAAKCGCQINRSTRCDLNAFYVTLHYIGARATI